MNDLEILQILVRAKELGIEQKDIDLFKPKAPDGEDIQSHSDIVKILTESDMPTEDEILYFATPYYDELQALKELKKQQLNDKEVGQDG